MGSYAGRPRFISVLAAAGLSLLIFRKSSVVGGGRYVDSLGDEPL